MNHGEVLSYITHMNKKKVKPFKEWKGSEIKDWEFEIELLNVGQNIDASNAVANFPMGTIPWLIKIEVLVRCIIKINGESFITQEQLNEYNKEHNLEGENAISELEYKKILIKKWDQVVVNKLEEAYNDLDKEHQKKLLGGVLNPENLGEEEKKKAMKIIQKIEKETQKEVKDSKEEKIIQTPGQEKSSLDVIASIEHDNDSEKKSE